MKELVRLIFGDDAAENEEIVASYKKRHKLILKNEGYFKIDDSIVLLVKAMSGVAVFQSTREEQDFILDVVKNYQKFLEEYKKSI